MLVEGDVGKDSVRAERRRAERLARRKGSGAPQRPGTPPRGAVQARFGATVLSAPNGDVQWTIATDSPDVYQEEVAMALLRVLLRFANSERQRIATRAEAEQAAKAPGVTRDYPARYYYPALGVYLCIPCYDLYDRMLEGPPVDLKKPPTPIPCTYHMDPTQAPCTPEEAAAVHPEAAEQGKPTEEQGAAPDQTPATPAGKVVQMPRAAAAPAAGEADEEDGGLEGDEDNEAGGEPEEEGDGSGEDR